MSDCCSHDRVRCAICNHVILDLHHCGDCIDALRAENERLRDLLREVAEGGVEFADPRVRYVAVQIDADTWERVKEDRP